MAGTPNRNTRRPQSGGTRRPQSAGRRPQSATRRPANTPRPANTHRPQNGRRRTARRRYTPLFMRPGFWLFVCIVVIVFILIFKGCDGDDRTDPTETGGAIVHGNTLESAGEPETEAPKPSAKPTEKPSEKPDEPSPRLNPIREENPNDASENFAC